MPDDSSTKPNPDRYQPGYVVDDTYLLKNLVGKGGMGSVFRAEHIIMKKEYALKFLAAEKISDINWQRFTLEARAIARMDHPSIVKIHNMGVDKFGVPYYVMDLLTGITLSDLCKKGSEAPLKDVIDIFIKLADGLSYAHKIGFIHRDIKPSNIVLVTNNDSVEVKLVDFGIAKLISDNENSTQALTKTGDVFGSPLYMSPEQCLALKCDQRSDIYSLGCSLFEVLAKTPPFIGNTAVETMMMHQKAPIPSLAAMVKNETAAQSLDVIMEKALAKNPEQRYQSMTEFKLDLEKVRQGRLVARISALESAGANDSADATAIDDGDDTTKLWTQTPIKANSKNKRILFAASAFAVLLCAIAAATAFFSNANHRLDTGNSNLLTPEEKQLQEMLHFPLIVSHDGEKDGKPQKILTFPSTRMGFIYAFNNKMVRGRFTAAEGQLYMPVGTYLGFNVSPEDAKLAFFNPEVFTRIGRDEFVELWLGETGSYRDYPGSAFHDKRYQSCALKVLDIASTWRRLISLNLTGLSLDSRSEMTVFNKFKRVSEIIFKSCSNLDKEQISRTTIFDDTVNLGFIDCKQVNWLLSGIDPKSINAVSLDNADITVDTIKILARFPALKSLRLANADKLTDEHIIHIGKLPKLSKLTISNVPLTRENISQLLYQSPTLYITLKAEDFATDKDIMESFKDEKRVHFFHN